MSADADAAASQLVTRFAREIRFAVAKKRRAYNGLFPDDELRQIAMEAVCAFGGIMLERYPSFHSRLPSWEIAAGGDERKLSRMVQHGLDLYLGAWCQGQAGALRRDAAFGRYPGRESDLACPRAETAQEIAELSIAYKAYPFLLFMFRDGLTQREIAERNGISRSEVQRRVRAEKDQLRTEMAA